jgi:hypothetical protein
MKPQDVEIADVSNAMMLSVIEARRLIASRSAEPVPTTSEAASEKALVSIRASVSR